MRSKPSPVIPRPRRVPVPRGPTAFLAAVFLLGSVEAGWCWRVDVGSGWPTFSGVVTTTPDGDVIADVGAGQSSADRVIVVESRTRKDGRRSWRRELPSPDGGPGLTARLVATAGGDVVGVGFWGTAPGRFVAFRAGRDPSTGWVRELADPASGAHAGAGRDVAIDAAGRVFIAGALGAEQPNEVFFAARLDADTGAEQWRFALRSDVADFAGALHLTTLADGDVLVGGEIAVSAPQAAVTQRYVLVRLDGTTGAERWRTIVDLYGARTRSTPVPDGVALVGAPTGAGFGIRLAAIVIDAASGGVRWSTELREEWTPAVPGSGLFTPTPSDALAVGGDLVIAATIPSTERRTEFTVFAMDLATGAERWRRIVPSRAGGSARALLPSPGGPIVVGGWTATPARCTDLVVATLSSSTGDILRTRTVDGTANADSCGVLSCTGPGCDERGRVDGDGLVALVPSGAGRMTVAAEMSMRRRGAPRAVLFTLPLPRGSRSRTPRSD